MICLILCDYPNILKLRINDNTINTIARTLVADSPVILADEPTGNLDSKTKDEIMNLLKISNKKYNQTIIMITHDLSLASKTDRIITIKDGKIISDTKC